jgi:hypothetical protein
MVPVASSFLGSTLVPGTPALLVQVRARRTAVRFPLPSQTNDYRLSGYRTR